MKLVSACLLSVECRYDGKSKKNKKVLELLRKEILIPVCPEELGGLPTPREKAEIIKSKRTKKVFTKAGEDLTENFKRGAEKILRITKLLKIKKAILKQGSPSCGCGKIYDGTFSGKLIKGGGITAELLKKNGIKIISEEDI